MYMFTQRHCGFQSTNLLILGFQRSAVDFLKAQFAVHNSKLFKMTEI